MTVKNEPDGADLLHGAVEIADFLGLNKRKAEYWIASTDVPVFKIGRAICARRSTLNQWLADQEAKARTAETAGK